MHVCMQFVIRGERNTEKCNLPELNLLSRTMEGWMCQGKAFILLTLIYTKITTPERMSVKPRKGNACCSWSLCRCFYAGAQLQHRTVPLWAFCFYMILYGCVQILPSDLYYRQGSL